MKVIVQHIATEYRDEGAGPVLLLLHGWQDSLHTFDVLTLLLAPAMRVVRLDLPGFGQSEAPAKTWNLDRYVQFVNDFIARTALQVDVLVGHSFGGRILIKGVATKNFQAKHLVLIASAGVAQRRTLRNAAWKVLAKAGRLATSIPPMSMWQESLRKKLYQEINSDYLGAGELQGTFLNIINEDLSAVAKTIATPTLLIWGSDDTETPLIQGERLSVLIQGSKLHVIRKAGHFVHQDQPEEVARLIREFLQ